MKYFWVAVYFGLWCLAVYFGWSHATKHEWEQALLWLAAQAAFYLRTNYELDKA